MNIAILTLDAFNELDERDKKVMTPAANAVR